MPTLMIAYDLCDPDSNSGPLTTAIRQLGDRWARPLATSWYVETMATPAEAEALLAGFICDDDALLVQEVIGQAALSNTVLRWSGQSVTCANPRAATTGLGSLRLVQPVPRLPNSEAAVAEAA